MDRPRTINSRCTDRLRPINLRKDPKRSKRVTFRNPYRYRVRTSGCQLTLLKSALEHMGLRRNLRGAHATTHHFRTDLTAHNFQIITHMFILLSFRNGLGHVRHHNTIVKPRHIVDSIYSTMKTPMSMDCFLLEGVSIQCDVTTKVIVPPAAK